MTTAPCECYTLRAATAADAQGIAALITAFDSVEFPDASPTTPGNIRADWEALELATDVWVVVAPGGALCGYMRLADAGDGFWEADGYVHPQHRGRGVGTRLVLASERRAHEIALATPEVPRVTLINHVIAQSAPARRLLEGLGYHLARVTSAIARYEKDIRPSSDLGGFQPYL